MNDFPPPVPTPGYKLRNATLDDLDEITNIHIDGFIEEPMDDYCYPLRFEQYADHFKWLSVEYQYYLENPHKYVVQVAEAQRQDEGDATADAKPVALAVWNLSVLADAPNLSRYSVPCALFFEVNINIWIFYTNRPRSGPTQGRHPEAC
jgi:hypothetical protein